MKPSKKQTKERKVRVLPRRARKRRRMQRAKTKMTTTCSRSIRTRSIVPTLGILPVATPKTMMFQVVMQVTQTRATWVE